MFYQYIFKKGVIIDTFLLINFISPMACSQFMPSLTERLQFIQRQLRPPFHTTIYIN